MVESDDRLIKSYRIDIKLEIINMTSYITTLSLKTKGRLANIHSYLIEPELWKELLTTP